ncbi:MAG: hypothetical protein LBK82_04140 [Planctomycetaceae bacterium]|nr:hypothetical protein [Planctomycetaceae bacterium]
MESSKTPPARPPSGRITHHDLFAFFSLAIDEKKIHSMLFIANTVGKKYH